MSERGAPPPDPGPDAPRPADGEHAADDAPPLAAAIRRVDDTVGKAERGLLFAAFVTSALTGLYAALLAMVFHKSSLAAVELTRVSAFAIGMFGAAYAAQNRRNFGLDLVSALMSTKVKAYTRVVTNLAAAVAAALLFYGGRLVQDVISKEKDDSQLIPKAVVGWFIPVCAALILFHVLCHLVIEIDYLRNGKTAPEPEVVG